MRYLSDREKGTQDWIAFHPADAPVAENIVEKIGLNPAKPVITLLTSVVWDAQLHYRQRAFKNQIEWVNENDRAFCRPRRRAARDPRPSRRSQRVVAVAPAHRLRDRGGVPRLPKNVALVRPGEDISTYALADASDGVIIYATKTGIELAARGIPVIVAGEAWLRGKGIGFDCDDSDAYEHMLAALPFRKRLDAERIARAQSYAYHFFFRRMIPLPGLTRARIQGAPYQIAAQGLGAFKPGAHHALDCMCKGILEGTPFVLDAGQTATVEA